MNVFETEDYKEYLRLKLLEKERVRGYKSQLAGVLGVKSSFLSQVLHGSMNLAPEHAVRLTRFWELDPLESEYFMEMVNLARAGSAELEQYQRQRLRDLCETRKHQSRQAPNFSQKPVGLTEGDDLFFAAAEWYHAAVNNCLYIPEFRTPGAIADRLGISLSMANESLSILEELGLARRGDEEWLPVEKHFQILRRSPFFRSMMRNWRHRAVLKCMEEHPLLRPLHETMIMPMSSSEMQKAREILVEALHAMRKSADQDANPQEIVVFNMDFFIP